MVPRTPYGGAGLLRALALAPLQRSDTGAVWRLSRCSLVFCFSLEVTRACAGAVGYRVREGCRLCFSALLGFIRGVPCR
mgnify:FL=1